MKLHTVKIKSSVLESHNITTVIHCRYYKIGREVLFRYYPGVVSACSYLFRQSVKNVVVAYNLYWRLHSMEYIWYVGQTSAKHLTYGLVTKAYAQNTFGFGILFNQIKHNTGLLRNARSR